MSIDLPKDIRLDSIYYNSVYFKIIQSGMYYKAKIIDIISKPSNDNKTLLYYNKNKKTYHCVIDKIVNKKPIFLP